MTRAGHTVFRRLSFAARPVGVWWALIGLCGVLLGLGGAPSAQAEPVVSDLNITVNNDRDSTDGAFFVDIHSPYTIHVFWPNTQARQNGHLNVSLRPADGGTFVTLWDKPVDLMRLSPADRWRRQRIPMTPASPQTSAFFGSGRDWIVRADLSAAGVDPVRAETTVRLMQGPADAGFAQMRFYDETRDDPGHPAEGHALPADGAVPGTARRLGYAWVPQIDSLPPGSYGRYRVTDNAGRVIEESKFGLQEHLQPGRPLILSERSIRTHPTGNGQMPAGTLALTVQVQTRDGIVIDTDTVRFRLPPTEARDPFGNAVEVAACAGDAARVRSCLSAGCSLGANTGAAAVMCAAEAGHAEIMDILLNQGATPHARSEDGRYSALFAAAEQGHATTVQSLIRHGADPNRRDYRGGTALHAAMWGGNLSLVQSLLDRGASPSIQDEKGRTAGYYAFWLHKNAALAARLGYHRPQDQTATRPPDATPVPPAPVSTMSEHESAVSADEIDQNGRNPSAHETLDDRGSSTIIAVDRDDWFSGSEQGGVGGGGNPSAKKQYPYPETKSFPKPTKGRYGIDWCLNWHTNCGKVTADYYCKIQGYERSVEFEKWENVPPTYLLEDEKICQFDYCDSFRFITCARGEVPVGSADSRRFFKPRIGAYSLHWCYQQSGVFDTEGLQCGEAPAHQFCKQNGYARAVKWEKWADAGSSYFMGDGVLCKSPQTCPGFRNIWCRK